MSHERNPVLSTARRKPIAACCAALFALAAPQAFATTWEVTTCADSGSGSLRDIVTNSAISGDTVDLSKLKTNYGCASSTISLTTGAITILQNDLTLIGPADRITLTGYYNGSYENDRILKHTGTGTLTLNYLNIEYNKFAPSSNTARGGCIYSAGNVLLDNARVFKCDVRSAAYYASGGGLYVKDNLTMKYSQLMANSVSGNFGRGGGAVAKGAFDATVSTISGNTSVNNVGGIYAARGASLSGSTVSGNVAQGTQGGTGNDGGLFVNGNAQTDSLLIRNSTISGNSATKLVGGVYARNVPVTVQNSTIAFNTSPTISYNGYSFAPGLTISILAGAPSIATTVQSSILSNNTHGITEYDFIENIGNVGTNDSIYSDHSIIRTASILTVTTACPLLGPLRSNGGPTQTHALLSGSPAIGAGANPVNLTSDQRGTGYPRMSGLATDIGAYEVQRSDIIFNSSFEGCPAL